MVLYVDIDGTLTKDGSNAYGKLEESRIDVIKKMIDSGQEVVIWSGRGTEYVRLFCDVNKITPLAAIGKPGTCIDDNPTIRPEGRINIISPEEYFKEV